jgi:hypothetical protein
VKLMDIVGRRGHVQVRFEDGPHPGLQEWVKTRQLVVAWDGRKQFLADERALERIKAHERQRTDPAVVTAIEAVLEATGEQSLWLSHGLACPVEALRRVMVRARLDGEPEDLHVLGFVDRFGTVHLPTDAAEVLARAFAGAEPESVTMYLEAEEAEMKARGYQAGDRIYHDFLREYRPGYALARQWAGFEQELDSLQGEIARLRGIIEGEAHRLEAAGKDVEAFRLRRALDGR